MIVEMKRGDDKRGYSRAFPRETDSAHYLLADIPATLWQAVREKATNNGLSMRAVILTLLSRWQHSYGVLRPGVSRGRDGK